MDMKLVKQLKEAHALLEILTDDYAGELFYVRKEGSIFLEPKPEMIEVTGIKFDPATKQYLVGYKNSSTEEVGTISLESFQLALQNGELVHSGDVKETEPITQAYKELKGQAEPEISDIEKSWNVDNTNVPNESKAKPKVKAKTVPIEDQIVSLEQEISDYEEQANEYDEAGQTDELETMEAEIQTLKSKVAKLKAKVNESLGVDDMKSWLDKVGIIPEQYSKDENNPTDKEIKDAYHYFKRGPGKNFLPSSESK